MLRAWVEAVMMRSKAGLVPGLYRSAMTVPSFCYHVAIKGRHALYDHGVLPVHTLFVPVISVGNLIAGGAGKTQVVMLLAEKLQAKGARLGIVSRGYKGKATSPIYVDPTQMQAEQCGDEAWMLANRFPEAIVVVGKNRVKAASLAEQLGADLILLDDGMQHRRLGRDVEIVVVDGQNPLADSLFLPKGPLRELPERLLKADLIVSVGPLNLDLEELPAHIVVDIIVDGLFDDKNRPVATPKKVGLFCGIGQPKRFIESAQSLGCEIIEAHFLADHEKITQPTLNHFAQKMQSQGADALICTEKDWVKGPFATTLPIRWLRTKMEVKQGHMLLESMIG